MRKLVTVSELTKEIFDKNKVATFRFITNTGKASSIWWTLNRDCIELAKKEKDITVKTEFMPNIIYETFVEECLKTLKYDIQIKAQKESIVEVIF